MGAAMSMRAIPKRKVQQGNLPANTGIVPPPRPEYDPMRGVPAGGKSITGGVASAPAAPPAPVRPPALSMRPVNAQASATPLPQRPVQQVAPQAAPAKPFIRPIQTIKPMKPVDPNAKAPQAWANGAMTSTATVGALPAAKNGKGGKDGKGKGGKRDPNAKLPMPLDPNAKLPGAAGNAGNGGVSGGASGSNGNAGNGTPQPTGPDLNAGRVDLMAQILNNPESMTPEVINSMVSQVADTRDLRAQDMQRRLKEQYAGRGMGESGVLDQLLFNENLAASQDIANAERGIRTDAARTNFNDRINSVNTALQQALGMGGLALQHQNMTNAQFNADRNFQLQLADAMTQTGLIGQQQQSSLLAQMNALISGGMSWQEALKQSIQQAAYLRYADPNVGAVSQVGAAPNPYLDYMASQNVSGGGGSSDTDWFNTALQGGAAIAGLFV